jgi:hypothetical protein
MPVFRGVAEHAAEGCLVKPLWHQFVQDPGLIFKFELSVVKPTPRRPDGWFHASQHPLATARELYQYLTHPPEKWIPPPMDYAMALSAMFGTMTHTVFKAMLEELGVMVPLPPGPCVACGRPRRPRGARPDDQRYCDEHGAIHAETRSRCHMDSILNYGARGTFGFDLKTIRPFGLKDVKDMDEQVFREKWPKYWAQMQECMRMSGLRRYIVFFLGLGIPWDTREFHVPFDPAFAAQTEAKYRRVIDHADREVPILL